MVLGSLATILFGGSGRPPSPRPETLPPPISLADARIRSAIGHIDSRSDLVIANERLSDTVKYVYERGLRVGGIFQTINAASSGHIEVIGNIDGEERLMGWISMNASDGVAERFEFRSAHGTLAKYRSQELSGRKCFTSMESVSEDWCMLSLLRVLEIAEAANFRVADISQDRSGDHAHIALWLGANGELGRGEIVSEGSARGIVYRLIASIGPKPVQKIDQDD